MSGLPLALGVAAGLALAAAGVRRGARNTDLRTLPFDAWFAGSVLADRYGHPREVFHQTAPSAVPAIRRQGFRLDLPSARKSDKQMPDGVFLKLTPTRIGVARREVDLWAKDPLSPPHAQLSLVARLTNPLHVRDRDELVQKLSLDTVWSRLSAQIKTADREYAAKFDASLNAEVCLRDESATDAIFEAWGIEVDGLKAQARARVTAWLRERGHDGLWMTQDEGTQGRVVETVVVLDPDQLRFFGETGPIGARNVEGVPSALRAVEGFARTHHVDLRLAPYAGFAHGGGVIEITDLFADETGKGAGSRVMQRLVETADAEGVNLVLHPSSGRNVTFYERFGFEMVPRVFGIPRMIRYAERTDE